MVKPSAPLFSEASEDENISIFCKQMLKTRVFRGSYQERRHVTDLKSFRDLVIIENSETELKSDLKYIKNRLETHYRNENVWVGISLPDMIGAPAGFCIWTEIENLPFGQYWFVIKNVQFKQNEVIVKLKHVRPSEESSQRPSYTTQEETAILKNFPDLLISWFETCMDEFLLFVNTQITKQNIKAALKFLFLLVLSFLTASVEVSKYITENFLKYFKEFRLLMATMMPLFLKVVDLIAKVIGAFFILIVMIYRELSGKKTSEIPRNPMIESARPNYIRQNPNNSSYNDNSRRNRRNY